MKNQSEIENAIAKLGIPHSYYMFDEDNAAAPPFLVWYFPDTDNFSADGKAYCKINRLNIELYTDQKDPELENKLESMLEENEIFWNKTEAFLKDEELYEVLYEMEVVIHGE